MKNEISTKTFLYFFFLDRKREFNKDKKGLQTVRKYKDKRRARDPPTRNRKLKQKTQPTKPNKELKQQGLSIPLDICKGHSLKVPVCRNPEGSNPLIKRASFQKGLVFLPPSPQPFNDKGMLPKGLIFLPPYKAFKIDGPKQFPRGWTNPSLIKNSINLFSFVHFFFFDRRRNIIRKRRNWNKLEVKISSNGKVQEKPQTEHSNSNT